MAFETLLFQVLQPQQHRAMLRPQVTLPMTPMVTLRNQAPGRIVLGQPQVHLKELHPGEDVSLMISLALCVHMHRSLGGRCDLT